MTALEQLVTEWRREAIGTAETTYEQGRVAEKLRCADALQAAIASERGGEAVAVAWAAGLEANMRGFIDTMAWREGEFTIPLYTTPPPAQAADRLSGVEREALVQCERLGAGMPIEDLNQNDVWSVCNALRRLAAPVTDGFVIVPREPTEAMVNAFHAGGGLHGYSTAVLGGLRSAIAIAATPPAGDAARGDG